MPTVTGSDGTTKDVRNLGWLLRHAGEVMHIEIQEEEHGEATLTAHLTGERTYRCAFASFEVACTWINRPLLRGVPCSVRQADGQRLGVFYP